MTISLRLQGSTKHRVVGMEMENELQNHQLSQTETRILEIRVEPNLLRLTSVDTRVERTIRQPDIVRSGTEH